jgi:ribbon-helix-helix CopG family protein
MRTTLSLDEDVAIELERMRRARHASLKDIINEALRRGLRDMNAPRRRRETFRTRAFKMGAPMINVDNIAETLAFLEGEAFK